MNQRLKRFCSMAACTAVIIPAMFLVQSMTGSGVANAACNGVGTAHEVLLQFRDGNGQLLVNERATPGTCNNNDLYQGTFRNETGDPSLRAVILVQNNGVTTPHLGGFDTAVHTYSFSDNNHHSDIQLCLDDTFGNRICGLPVFTATGF